MKGTCCRCFSLNEPGALRCAVCGNDFTGTARFEWRDLVMAAAFPALVFLFCWAIR